MTIFFNYGRKIRLLFEEQKLLDLQTEVTDRINQLLNPFSKQLEEDEAAPGFIQVNYYDEQCQRPFIEIFNVDGDTKMDMLSSLQCLYSKA